MRTRASIVGTAAAAAAGTVVMAAMESPTPLLLALATAMSCGRPIQGSGGGRGYYKYGTSGGYSAGGGGGGVINVTLSGALNVSSGAAPRSEWWRRVGRLWFYVEWWRRRQRRLCPSYEHRTCMAQGPS